MFFRRGFLNITVLDSLRVGRNRGGEGGGGKRTEGAAPRPPRELPLISNLSTAEIGTFLLKSPCLVALTVDAVASEIQFTSIGILCHKFSVTWKCTFLSPHPFPSLPLYTYPS